MSNELGAGNPEAAKFSVVVAVLTSAGIGVLFTAVALATKNQLPKMFTEQPEVINVVRKTAHTNLNTHR